MQNPMNTLEETRAFFGARRAELSMMTFCGAESLSYTKELTLTDCHIAAPHTLSHVSDAILRNIVFDKEADSPLFGAISVTLQGCEMDAPSGCHAARDITVDSSRIASDDFAADSRTVTVTESVLSGARLFSHAEDVTLAGAELSGTRALSYVKGGQIDFSTLTGDGLLLAAENITISDTVLDGARIGWYSENLTLTHCVIAGATPFCHAKNLTLIDCTLDASCLGAFERSEVEATLRGTLPSVRNPLHGHITADALGEVLFDETAAAGTDCRVDTKK